MALEIQDVVQTGHVVHQQIKIKKVNKVDDVQQLGDHDSVGRYNNNNNNNLLYYG